MSLSKITMLAAALALGLPAATVATRTYAQSQNNPGNMLSDVGEDEIVYMKGDKMTKGKMKLSAAMHAKAMSMGAKETEPRMIKGTGMAYRHGGKVYFLANKAGSGGKTMIQESFQDVFGGDHQY